MFRVGQKVVCVDAQPQYSYEPSPLTEGAIYTVAFSDDIMGVLLAELNPPADYISFNPIRFRPVVETDISIFTAMLSPNKRELVDALPSRRQEGV